MIHMVLRNRVFLTLSALTLLSATGALYAQLEGEDRGVAPVNSTGDFMAPDIVVDVSGDSAEDARQKGWQQAQRMGWSKLWAKTHGGAGAGLADGSLNGIVSSIEVVEENIGPRRYKATLNIYFDRARAGQILGVGGIMRRSAPMLVIPLEISGGAQVVFERRTDWQKAWARFRTSDSTIDYVRPSGAGSESLIVNAGQVERRNREWWRLLLDQFGAADVIMPVVRLERKYPGGPIVGHFAARQGADNRLIGSFSLRAANEEALPKMLDEAVKRMDGLYAQALSMGMLRPDRTLVVEQPVDDDAVIAPPKEQKAAPANRPERSATEASPADLPDPVTPAETAPSPPQPVPDAPAPSPKGTPVGALLPQGFDPSQLAMPNPRYSV